MHASLTCTQCNHAWQLVDEPRFLVALACPSCQTAAEPCAAEEFASALEDALVQLYELAKTHSLEVRLSTQSIPASFCPDTAAKQSP